jgi:mRNA interferase MazF
MIDKALTVRKDKVGLAGGRLERETMLEIERCLAVFLGIAK